MQGCAARCSRDRHRGRSSTRPRGAARSRFEPAGRRRRRRLCNVHPFRRARHFTPITKCPRVDRPTYRQADQLLHDVTFRHIQTRRNSCCRVDQGCRPGSAIWDGSQTGTGGGRGSQVDRSDASPSGGAGDLDRVDRTEAEAFAGLAIHQESDASRRRTLRPSRIEPLASLGVHQS